MMRAWRKWLLLLWFAVGAVLAEAPEPLENVLEEQVTVQAAGRQPHGDEAV